MGKQAGLIEILAFIRMYVILYYGEGGNVITKMLQVKNAGGLHVRPAGVLVKICRAFEAEVLLKFNGNKYNLKSVLGIISAGIKNGDSVEFICDGVDEKEALEAVVAAIESNFEIV